MTNSLGENKMVKIFILALALLAIGVLLYLRRQHIKRKERDDIDIPVFLRGGNYALHNSPGTKIIDPVHIYPITPKVKKRD
jgi:hypothetical protein